MTALISVRENSHLYVLVFPVRGVFKVGKADVIVRRMHTLERTWGAVDVRASYHVAADRDTVFTLERTLLMVLSDHAVGEEVGDGRTELFSLTALELALKQLELFSAARAVPLALRQGLPDCLRSWPTRAGDAHPCRGLPNCNATPFL